MTEIDWERRTLIVVINAIFYKKVEPIDMERFDLIPPKEEATE